MGFCVAGIATTGMAGVLRAFGAGRGVNGVSDHDHDRRAARSGA